MTEQESTLDPTPWLEHETGLRFSKAKVERENAKDRCWRGLGFSPRPEFGQVNHHREDFLVRIAKGLRLMNAPIHEIPWNEAMPATRERWIENARKLIDGAVADREMLVLAAVGTESESMYDDVMRSETYEYSFIESEFIVAHQLSGDERARLAATVEDAELYSMSESKLLSDHITEMFGPELEAERDRNREAAPLELVFPDAEPGADGQADEGAADR